ncbi:MAG: 6-carboxytetrahydropterin synthase QueD [Planctomycetota bacterium]|jgi:6-pyruvoyltetrahydropterin/6-carboxytetrahydropterin synthase|nr:6-carboxytetrahydropterin synthase QueD [Planctomycetota bacterium]
MFTLEVEDHFSAAHQLREYRGKCENLHGHNWRVKVAISGAELPSNGMLMDFGDLKRILAVELNLLDHQFLNQIPPFDRRNPTSESIAQYLFQRLAPQLPATVQMSAVTVWESEKCCAVYSERV